MTRPVPDIALQFIERAEGEKSVVYLDKGGRATGGVGHLMSAGEVAQYPVGSTVPQPIIDAWLQTDLQVAVERLAAVLPEAVILSFTDHQYAALISFVFNVGCNAGWTIWKVIKAGKLDQVPGQLIRFDKVKNTAGQTVVVKGLQNRRNAEIMLWNTPDLEAALHCAAACPLEQPSSYTREVITPPTPAVLPAHFIASAVAKSGTVVGGVGSAAASVQEQIAPHADVAPVFHTALVICVGVTVACGILGLAIHGMQAKEATQ